MLDKYACEPNSAEIGTKGAISEGSVRFWTKPFRIRLPELRIRPNSDPQVAGPFLQYIKASILSSKSVLHWSSPRKQLYRNKDNYIQHSKKTFIQQVIVLACRLLKLFHTNPQNHNSTTSSNTNTYNTSGSSTVVQV